MIVYYDNANVRLFTLDCTTNFRTVFLELLLILLCRLDKVVLVRDGDFTDVTILFHFAARLATDTIVIIGMEAGTDPVGLFMSTSKGNQGNHHCND